MNGILLAGWLLTALAPASPDTTVTLRRGDRVVVENLSGRIVVRGGDRSTLSLRGRDDPLQTVSVRRDGARVTVGSTDRKGRGLDVEMELLLPSWVAVEVQGREADVTVSGMKADVGVRVVEGDIRATDVAGVIALSTVDGEIEVADATGKISARSRGDDVTVRRAQGELMVHSGSGDIHLEEIRAASVTAETLDGDLLYQGIMARAGTYAFSVHDGDAEIVVPADSGIQARVATFDGEFTSDFPVTLQGYGGDGRFEFTLGDGGARLEIQVFDGEIRLLSTRR